MRERGVVLRTRLRAIPVFQPCLAKLNSCGLGLKFITFPLFK